VRFGGGARGVWLARRLRLARLAPGLLAAAVVVAVVVVAPGTPSSARSYTARAANRPPTWHFHSEPNLHPPVVSVTTDPDTSSGDIFLAPFSTQGRFGLMILNPKGQLVWYDSVAPVEDDLEVQSYHGRPVLTWWQATKSGAKNKREDVIANLSYRVLAVVRAGKYTTDDHDFVIGPNNTAWLMVTRNLTANLTRVGGPSRGIVQDFLVQEVDIATGKVLWQWDAYRHIPLNASYSPPSKGVYDAYHLNSIQLLPGRKLLVSSRNAWSVYEISTKTGHIVWTLGGKYNQFKRGPGTKFEWQHTARLAGSTLTLFDDADIPGAQEEPQSSAKVIRLNYRKRTARLIHAYDHSPPLLAGSKGNAQTLPNGNLFVGWGVEPDFSEYTPAGRQIFNGTFALGVQSYRAFRFRWSGQPATPPDMALTAGSGGSTNVWASWNGATNVASWRVRSGSSSRGPWTKLKTAPRSNFETQIPITGAAGTYVEVQALNSHRAVLGTSSAQPIR
jgi:hypothetical protein